MDDTAFTSLQCDPLLHADMLELLSQPGTRVAYASDRACLLVNEWLAEASAERPEDAALLARLAREAGAFACVGHQKHLWEPLAGQGFQPKKLCLQCVYTKKEPVAYTLPADTEIRPLDASHAPFVAAHYTLGADLDDARDRIESGMLGAFVGGVLAGFIGTHEDGSMGMLEILPAYRRRHLGYALEAALINRRRDAGRTPFGQVFEDNAASLRLQEKLGMTFAEGRIFWAIREE